MPGNAKALTETGLTNLPADWDKFLAICKALNGKSVVPNASGSGNHWPTPFRFD